MTVDALPPETVTLQEPTATTRHPHGPIVAALDGSARDELVLKSIVPLAEAFASRVICVRVVESISPTLLAEASLPGPYAPFDQFYATQNELRAEDTTYLAGIKERLARRGIEVECEAPTGRPAQTIIAVARMHRAKLIAMTTHGRRGLRRALLGSVADEVVRTAPCPVLLVRIQAEG